MSVTWQSEAMKRERVLADAYDDGHKAARLDRSIGIKSEYSFNCASDGGYPGAYSSGYRDGILGLASNNPHR